MQDQKVNIEVSNTDLYRMTFHMPHRHLGLCVSMSFLLSPPHPSVFAVLYSQSHMSITDPLENNSSFYKQAVEKHVNFTLRTGVSLLLGFFQKQLLSKVFCFSPLAFSVQAFIKIPVVTLKQEGERVQGRSESKTNVCVPSHAGCSRQRRPGRRQRNGAVR